MGELSVNHQSFAGASFQLASSGSQKSRLFAVIAVECLESGDKEHALVLIKEAVVLDPTNPSIEYLRGNVEQAFERYGEAIRHYQRSIELGRDDGWPEASTALIYKGKGDLANAEAWFRKAIARGAATMAQRGEEWGYRNLGATRADHLNEFAWFLVTTHSADASRAKEALTFSEQSNELTKYENAEYL